MDLRREQISVSTIDNLIIALTRLKDSGDTLLEGNFWTDSSLVTPILQANDPNDQAKQARELLGELSAMHKALDVLRVSCQDRLDNLRAEFSGSINKAGLLSLPNEILRQILREAGNDEVILPGKKTFAMTISQVCRFLRECALDTPELWTRLSTNVHIMELILRVERSQSCLLDVEVHAVNAEYPPRNMDESLQILINVAIRWRSFSFKCCEYRSWEAKAREQFHIDLAKNMTDLELPELQSLQIIDIVGRNFIMIIDEGSPVFDFYETWEMPKLIAFDTAFNLPLRPLSAPIWRNLKSASIWITGSSDEGEAMLQFLALCSGLQELSLRIGNPMYRTRDCLRIIPHREPSVNLPEVKVLKLIVSDPTSIWTLRTRLFTPAIEKLTLDILYDPTNPFTGGALYNSFNYANASQIKDLEVKLESSATLRLDMVDLVLSRYTSLTQLTIEAPDTEINTTYRKEKWVKGLPPLRSLCFRNCTKLDPTFVDFVSNLSSREEDESVKSVEIIHPPVLNKEFVKRNCAAFRDKTTWYQSSGYNRQRSTYDMDSDSESDYTELEYDCQYGVYGF